MPIFGSSLIYLAYPHVAGGSTCGQNARGGRDLVAKTLGMVDLGHHLPLNHSPNLHLGSKRRHGLVRLVKPVFTVTRGSDFRVSEVDP